MPVKSLMLTAVLVSANLPALSAQVVPPAAPKPAAPQPQPPVPAPPARPAPVIKKPAVPAPVRPVRQPRARRVRPNNNASSSSRNPASSDKESVLKISCLKTTDQALLDFFRKRTLPTPQRHVVEQVTQTLASPKPAEADAAQAELVSWGSPVAALVREIANGFNSGQATQRAKQILQILEGPLAPNLPIEIARLLTTRKPAGAVEILLDYLAVADNDDVIREVVAALAAIGCPKGQPEPAIMAALHSLQTVRRAAAAQILCQVGGTANLKAVRPLMKDPDPTVRFKATLALADAYDSEAIPVLVDLLAESPSSLQAQVEKYLTQLAGEFAVHGPKGQDALSRLLRYHTWLTWWQYTDGPHVLQAFRAHTLTDEELEKAETSLRQLGALDVKAKELAMRELIALGGRVVPLLRRAVQQQQPQTSPAAEQCLNHITSTTLFSALPEAALRLLQMRRPVGAVAALLAYLPCAEDETAVDRIQEALVRIGVVDGKADAVLVQALQSKIGLRRSAAVTALCRGHATGALASARPLLEDKDLEVRQQVAREMALAGDKEAIVVLIDLLDKLPKDRVWVVEHCLEKLAGNKAPAEASAGEEVSWTKVGHAWLEWWKGDKSKVKMVDADAESFYHGYTLLVQTQNGSITELDAQGKPRWTLKGLANPNDAQVLSGQRVLVVEQGRRVTERNLQGKVLWEKQIPGTRICNVQRLRNGNTFIACQDRLIEVDRAGKEVQTIPSPRRGIQAARKLPNGQFVYSDWNTLVHLDQKGRELKSVQLRGGGGSREILDNGHVLVSDPGLGSLIELDADGKEVGHFNMQGIIYGFRLPNGHTLLTLGGRRGLFGGGVGGNKYIELDKNWKQIKETPLDAPTQRVKGR